MLLEIDAGEFGYIQTFLMVAQEGTFSAAGRKLGISGSAVGQTIRQLEQRMGLQLFVRTTRTVALTEQGQKLFEEMKPAAIALSDVIATAKSAKDLPTGRVRVYTSHLAAEQILLPILPAFAEHYPDISIDLTISDMEIDLLSEGYDVGLIIGETVNLDMVAVRVGPQLRQIAVATPEFVHRFGRPEHPRDLVNFRCLRWRWAGRDHPYDWEFFEDGRWFSIRVGGPLLLTDRQLLLQLCLMGAGIGFVGSAEVSPQLEKGELINLLDHWCAPFPGWHLCFPRQKFLPRPIRLFVDAVRGRPKDVLVPVP